jgi:hypothetical protein
MENDILNLYQEFTKSNLKSFDEYSDEFQVISILKDEIEWKKLTYQERQNKRIGLTKRMEHKLMNRSEIYLLMNSIVELHKIIVNVLERISTNSNLLDTISYARLNAMLNVELYLINEFFDIKKSRFFNYPVLINILNTLKIDEVKLCNHLREILILVNKKREFLLIINQS